MTEPVRIVLADDHPVFRDGLRGLLSSLPNMAVVAEAGTGAEAVAAAQCHHPDVVVMDLHMPGLNGIEATRRIVGADPGIGVLVLTMLEDDDSVFAAMRAGARGYLLKGADQDEIAMAVRAVAGGDAIFGPAIARRVINYFSAPQPSPQPFAELSAREREVLDLIAAGHANPAIASQLFLSHKTVRNHVSSIFTKLQVADRAQAIVRARQAGLGQGPLPSS